MRGVRGLSAALSALLCVAVTPLHAADADETVFETVGGYEVTLDRKPEGLNPCRAGREYKDPKDNNAENAVVIARIGEAFVISLVYEKWNWEKGKTYKASLSIDNQVIDKDAQWIGQGMALVITVPKTILPKLRTGKRIVLGFRDGNADFELADFAPAYEAMVRCDAAAAQAKSAPLPNETRAAAYLMGLSLEDAIRRCDIATTAKQRTGLADRLAALRPEMGEAEAPLRAAIEKAACAASEARVSETLAAYVERTPEAFVAEWEGRGMPMLARVKPILAGLRPAEAEKSGDDARLAAYAFGLLMQNTVRNCDIATTAKQRAGLDAKVASLQAEMAPYEAAMREQIKLKTGTCPASADSAELQTKLNKFIDLTPEAFVAEMDKTSGDDAKTAKK